MRLWCVSVCGLFLTRAKEEEEDAAWVEERDGWGGLGGAGQRERERERERAKLAVACETVNGLHDDM